jgi:hypothetical protein
MYWKPIVELAFCVFALSWWIYQTIKRSKARHWPLTEATIESGSVEVVARSRYGVVRLPVFAFSYEVAGTYFGGRFALLPYITDPDESLFSRMTGRKLQVHYNPGRFEEWYLPDKIIEGCKIEQKIGPHLNSYYPQ